MDRSTKITAWVLLTIMSLIWGSSFILIKKGLQVYAPEEVGSLRILAAGLFLSPLAITRLSLIRKSDIPWLLSVGFVGSLIPAFLFAKAQTQISSSLAGILNALTPMFVMLIGIIMFKQPWRKKTVLGLLIGLMGSIVLVSNGNGELGNINFYAFFVVIATICYGFNVNLIKYRLNMLRAITITSISLLLVLPLAATHLFLMTSFLDKLQNIEGAGMAMLYIVILGVMGTSIALIMFNHLVQLTDPIFTSLVTYLIPVVAVFWGIFDNEPIGVVMLAGFLTIISGVYLINKGQKVKVTRLSS